MWGVACSSWGRSCMTSKYSFLSYSVGFTRAGPRLLYLSSPEFLNFFFFIITLHPNKILMSQIYCYILHVCCSVAKVCLTLCDPVDCSMPSFPVLHYLLEFVELMCIDSVMPSNHLILCCPLEKGMANHSSILALRTLWIAEKANTYDTGKWAPRVSRCPIFPMLLGKSREVAPERMKRLGQSGNDTQLWMCGSLGILGPWIKRNWIWSSRRWQEWTSTILGVSELRF